VPLSGALCEPKRPSIKGWQSMDRRTEGLLVAGIVIGGAGVGAFSALLLDAHLVSREAFFPLQPMLLGALAGIAIATLLYLIGAQRDH